MRNTFPTSHTVLESDRWKALSLPAKTLYQIMCKLSNRFGYTKEKRGTPKEGWFTRSTRELMTDSGLSINSIVKARKQLVKFNLIKMTTHKKYHEQISNDYMLLKYKKMPKSIPTE